MTLPSLDVIHFSQLPLKKQKKQFKYCTKAVSNTWIYKVKHYIKPRANHTFALKSSQYIYVLSLSFRFQVSGFFSLSYLFRMSTQAESKWQVLGELCRFQIQVPTVTAVWHHGTQTTTPPHTHTPTPLLSSCHAKKTHACKLAATRMRAAQYN